MKVVVTTSLELAAEKISYLLEAEVESATGSFKVKKKRFVKNSETTFCLMNVNLLVESFEENGIAVNKANVYLLPEEMPFFTSALIQHPIPFPTNFSQRLTRNRGIYCVQLESQEAPENFAKRLSAALKLIERQQR